MIAEIRIRYAAHALLLVLTMFSGIFSLWLPWFYVIRHREELEYTSLWSLDGISTTQVAREIVMSQTRSSWNAAGFPSIGKTFKVCFYLALTSVILAFVQFVCIVLMSFFVRRCLYNLRVWSYTLRNIYAFLAFSTFALFTTSTCYFLKISVDLQVDQSVRYRDMPCLAHSPCFQFIGNNADNLVYEEWGPVSGWCAVLAAALFSFLSTLSSFLLQGRLKIRTRRVLVKR